MEKIGKQFDTPAITEDTDEATMEAARNLWRPLTEIELVSRDQYREQRNQANIQSYLNLMEKFNSFFVGESLFVVSF